MITRPYPSQLLDVVRTELRGSIAPAINDPLLKAQLDMIDSILGAVSRRCDHEVGWMREEIAQIEDAADEVVATQAPGSERVAEALSILRGGRAPSLHLSDVQAEYNLASEVLSRSLEAAMPVGGDLGARVVALLDARVQRETEIRGEFSLAGRA